MNILFDLPEILQATILTEWLLLYSVKRVDLAVCSKIFRPEFLRLLQADLCNFPAGCDAFYLNSKWIMKRGIKVKEAWLPKLGGALRKQFLQYLRKSSIESMTIDSDTFEPYTEEIVERDLTKKVCLVELDEVLQDIVEYCPDIKKFDMSLL